MKTKFICFLKVGNLAKIEKHEGETLETLEKVAEAGIDAEENIELYGPEQPLRAEYEAWVSAGGAPEYFNIDEPEEE